MKLLRLKREIAISLVIGILLAGAFLGYLGYTIAQAQGGMRCVSGTCSGTADADMIFIGSQTPSDVVDKVNAGDGDDQIYNSGQTAGSGEGCSGTSTNNVGTDLNGEGGNDLIVDNDLANTLNGGDGHDALFANGGNDCLVGDGGGNFPGDDFLSGGPGDDRFAEGAGNDTVIGGRGDDTYTAGPGDDVFVIFRGDVNKDETIECGKGTDTIVFVGWGTTDFPNVRGTNDTALQTVTDPETGGTYKYQLSKEDGEDYCENVVGM